MRRGDPLWVHSVNQGWDYTTPIQGDSCQLGKGEREVSWIGAGWSAWEEEDSLRSPDAHDANPRDRLPFVQ
ncbi:hypothetical protein TNIN_343261 [Trichonephila inaurata madagascariensis]|uniref:Uncharacterized protein n=1 Tax=Trichonephila inaurata madagascariensis TaxID=2747483 RepID=A0A8X7C1B0_9ARAC|nr:hypothetical protein TNIN_343261 [Trichonephila inaurata madagascariensis]